MHPPESIPDLESLEDALSAPSEALVKALAQVPGPIMVLGVGGKMGPSLARMAKRADPGRQVMGVARFSQPQVRDQLLSYGIDCIAADLMSADALANLPDAPNVVFMAGRKFGSSGSESLTWAMNSWVPAMVAQRFRHSRIVAFSTACVYPFVETAGAGAREADSSLSPLGEYANSCVARERLFEYFSQAHGTPGRQLRLSYAIDMRYGVLHDIAQNILNRKPIDLSMGHANIIWQAEANERALRALAHCTTPTTALNLSGPRIAIADMAIALGERLGVEPILVGQAAPTALLVDCSLSEQLFGPVRVGIDSMLDWTADWIQRGGVSLALPTHYETRDGIY